ncbi:MAG TPA: DUF2298 domain-containing protein [Dehalococcoidia bacterium]|nr:DUF2298 domain-containing protein [Dehalococcoidia bacterium]MDP6272892.1 DUF2298 domain-containing protein [Dehalococcoidia bacterium]MDP7212567.1 DUF2298 domain-containing protein [Dehalococcoidia bacterium]MDP7514332.1 DUF2298 domain-containing protein [Dehalococcoidia bacterium]HJM52452.1 DUF2298 domain-containing protein [Dehalococcoidia bacterium]
MLALIVFVALGLRIYGIDWDDGGLFHPDERAILMQAEGIDFPSTTGEFGDLLSAEDSSLNPRWFNYGSLPLYTLRLVQAVASPVTDWDLFDLRIPGRVISALADTVTITLVFALGARWYGRRVGLLAAALTALAVIHIQLSHFFAVDTILAMFILATLLVSVRVAHTGARRDIVLAGLLFGLAVATKASAFPMILAIAVSHLIYTFSVPGDRFALAPADLTRARRFVLGGLIAGSATFAALAVAQPYMFLDFDQYWADLGREGQMVRRIVDFPYTRQYEDTPRYLYQGWQLATWGLGPALGLAVWAGLAGGVIAAWRSSRKVDLVVLAWVIPYLAVVGWFDVKFMRYMLPVTPLLLIYGSRAAWGFSDAWRWVARLFGLNGVRHAAAPLVVGGLLLFTAHYALAFESMYAQPHPAQEASDWIAANAAPGSTILKEHWDEGLPELYQYDVRELPLYESDSVFKLADMSASLADADYLVVFSNRLYGTIPRLPERYPITSVYYEKLFAGELGYTLAYSNNRETSFLGMGYDANPMGRVDLPAPDGFNDPEGLNVSFGWADESFTVYDHTRPLVFENSGRYLRTGIERNILKDVQFTSRTYGLPDGLQLNEAERVIQVSGGTLSEIVDLGTDTAGWSWIVWLFAIQGLGLVALPIGYVLFRPFPNRGYLLHKPLGLLLVTSVTWFMASVGIADFSRGSVFLAIAIWALVAGVIGWRLRSEIQGFLRTRWRLIFGMEALFLAAFIGFLLIRFANPDLWHQWRGGEKPMDFAYLNAVTRSTVMPPYDPWFAGGYLNYYYFGQFIVATVIRLTGIVPSVAYNLAIPMLAAMTVGGAFTVVHGLVERAQLLRPGAVKTGATSAVVAGLIGALFVTIIGNMDGLFQVVSGTNRVLFEGRPFGEFDFWRSSRMYAWDSGGNEITEFPFFSFLFADLHAHLIAIPFALLTVGLAISAFLRATSVPKGGSATAIAGLAVLGLSVGALRIINAWDFPTSMGFIAIALIAGELLSRGGTIRSRLAHGTGRVIFVGVLSYALFLPFHQRYEVEVGLDRNEILSPLWRYMTIYGIFLLGIAAYLAVEIKRVLRSGESTDLAPNWMRNAPPVTASVIGLATALLAVIVHTGHATLAFTLIGTGLLAFVWLLAYRQRVADRMELGMVTAIAAVALGLGAFPELFLLNDDISRQNTVFKFYLQAWILFGIASAYLLWRLWAFGESAFSGGEFLTWKRVRGAGIGVFVLMLAIGLIYPALATPARISDRINTHESGLDGTAFMADAVLFEQQGPLALGDDVKGIRWLEENVEGSPIIVEGISALYGWGNRVSIYTGLPAVIGWEWHQIQQRPGFEFDVVQRRYEVDNFYSTPHELAAVNLLRKYDVKYVYVGELERTHYPGIGTAKFRRMESYGLTLVYEEWPVAIYEYRDPGPPVVSR